MKTQDIETANKLASSASNAMHKHDTCAHTLGIEPVDVAPGKSIVTMKIRDDMLNGHGICHGGIIFTLADTAFAHACNSYNKNTVALCCSIDFIKPVKLNDTLTAKAVERSLNGRTGLYDITVINQEGEDVAHFRGRSYRIQGSLVSEENE